MDRQTDSKIDAYFGVSASVGRKPTPNKLLVNGRKTDINQTVNSLLMISHTMRERREALLAQTKMCNLKEMDGLY